MTSNIFSLEYAVKITRVALAALVAVSALLPVRTPVRNSLAAGARKPSERRAALAAARMDSRHAPRQWIQASAWQRHCICFN
jgi:hypothetical protein